MLHPIHFGLISISAPEYEVPLSRPLRKFHPQDQMSVSKPIHFLTSPRSIHSVHEGDECKALRSLGVSIFGQENSGDPSKALKQLAQFLLLRHFRDLLFLVSNGFG